MNMLNLPPDLWPRCFGRRDIWLYRLVCKDWHRKVWAWFSRLKAKEQITHVELQQIITLCGRTLAHLNLSGCHKITGKNLAQLKSFSRLIGLDLRDTCKSSRALRDEQILLEVGNLTKLEYFQISVSWETFMKEHGAYFPEKKFWQPLQNLKKLTHLSLNYLFHPNYFPLLSEFPSLQYLEVKLFSSLDEFPRSLRDYDLEDDNNYFEDTAFQYVSKSIQTESHLQTFNGLSLKHLKTLVVDIPRTFSINSLSVLTTLEVLSIVYSLAQCEAFNTALLQLTNLESLTSNHVMHGDLTRHKKLTALRTQLPSIQAFPEALVKRIYPNGGLPSFNDACVFTAPNLLSFGSLFDWHPIHYEPEETPTAILSRLHTITSISLYQEHSYRISNLSEILEVLQKLPLLVLVNGVSVKTEAAKIPIWVLPPVQEWERAEPDCRSCRFPLSECECR